jgi:hypothetical protein
MATPIGKAPPSMAETTGDRLISVLVVVVFSVLVSLFVVALRIWCRWSIRALGWDDFAATMSLVSFEYTLVVICANSFLFSCV